MKIHLVEAVLFITHKQVDKQTGRERTVLTR